MTSQNDSDITLRIICLDAPVLTDDPRVIFGLQDKSHHLTKGEPLPDGSLAFTVPIKVKGRRGIASPDFAGPSIHGTPQQRFLYLSLGSQQGEAWQWIRRIKVPLSGITWQHIEDTQSNGGILEASVDGTKSGTVPLLGEEWIAQGL